jgi:hypothetical protein
VLLTNAAASLAAATATTDSNLKREDSRMNLDNNMHINESTNNKGEGPISNEAISNVTENQPPPAAGDQNNTLTNVSCINPATGNNDSDSAPSFNALTSELHWRRGLLFCI